MLVADHFKQGFRLREHPVRCRTVRWAVGSFFVIGDWPAHCKMSRLPAHCHHQMPVAPTHVVRQIPTVVETRLPTGQQWASGSGYPPTQILAQCCSSFSFSSREHLFFLRVFTHLLFLQEAAPCPDPPHFESFVHLSISPEEAGSLHPSPLNSRSISAPGIQ